MSPRHLRETANMSLNMSNGFSHFNEIYMDTKQSMENPRSHNKQASNLLLNQDYNNYMSAALSGEPIEGIGSQVKKNRQKMIEIFKKGRAKTSNDKGK